MDPKQDELYKIRHSLAHIMAQAVLQIRPRAKLAFGPPIEDGFYYDFDLEEPLTPENFRDIEKRMRKIIAERQPFESFSRSVAEAVKLLGERGEIYKVEYAEELAGKGETALGFYKNGPFEDMCRGPHVEHTGKIPPDCFAIESLAGAYWRGDEKRKQLTRLYVLAFENRQKLEEHQERQRLAKERDHRKLGAELELYTISDEVGPGLILWLPNGTIIRDELENFAKEIEFRAGYHRVSTPHITRANLYYTSGHLPYYQSSMFPPMQREGEEPYFLKPMNCPHHHMVYKSRPRSYRELPYRLGEYGTCYRHEDSGSLSGLLRVRMLSMNDAHIYCAPEQVQSEFQSVIEMSASYYRKFRLTDYKMRLSLHDPANTEKFLDEPEAWKFSEAAIKNLLDDGKYHYEIGVGEAAFYGPKIDYQIRNVIGREETCSTIQLDFAARTRFELTYRGEDGELHQPYVIHRAPLSTHERFLAFLIEHFGGAFPTWMAPLQVMIIPVSEKFAEYAEKLRRQLADALVRVEVDNSNESFNKRIRNAVTKKTPNMLIVGGKEEETESVTWRRYAVKDQHSLKFAEFSDLLARMIRERVMDNFADRVQGEALGG